MVGIILSEFSSVSSNQIKLVSNVMSNAFYNDPLMVYFFPNPTNRKTKLPLMMELLIRIGINYGIVHITSLKLEGLAIWLPSTKAKITPWMSLLNGGVSYFLKLGYKAVKKQIRLYNYTYSMHEYLIPSYHWYLVIIGIDPSYQRRGLSRLLFNPMFNQIDGEKLSCFLDTNNKNNLPFYKRFGFKILKEYKIPDTNLMNWAMIRE